MTTATARTEEPVKIIDFDIDITDAEIILLVMKGRNSAYSAWASMKKDAKEGKRDRKVMTYRNINKRFIRLAKLGLIEEINPDTHSINIYARKDYNITMKGLECLIPHMMAYPDDVKTIIQHVDKFGVDKKAIGNLLVNRIHAAVEAVNQFLKFVELPEIEAIYSRRRAVEIKLLQHEVEKLRELSEYSNDYFKKIDQILSKGQSQEKRKK